MTTAITQAIASILAYAVARGIDTVIGKWVAMFMVAWEKTASDKAMSAYRDQMKQIVDDMPGKWNNWDQWRQSRFPKG